MCGQQAPAADNGQATAILRCLAVFAVVRSVHLAGSGGWLQPAVPAVDRLRGGQQNRGHHNGSAGGCHFGYYSNSFNNLRLLLYNPAPENSRNPLSLALGVPAARGQRQLHARRRKGAQLPGGRRKDQAAGHQLLQASVRAEPLPDEQDVPKHFNYRRARTAWSCFRQKTASRAGRGQLNFF